MIFSFRYRAGVRGVITGHLEAVDLVAAGDIAQRWVNSQPGSVFIPNSCEPWLITAPAVEGVAVEAVPEGPTKPDHKTQKANLREQAQARMAGAGVGSAVKPEGGRVGA